MDHRNFVLYSEPLYYFRMRMIRVQLIDSKRWRRVTMMMLVFERRDDSVKSDVVVVDDDDDDD